QLDAQYPWLDPARPVPVGHLVAASAQVRWGVRLVAERLVALGYRLMVDPRTLPAGPTSPSDAVLVSRQLDAQYPWLDPARPVPVGHLVAASAQVGQGIREVAELLAAFGCPLAVDLETLPTLQATAPDATLVNQHLDVQTWLERTWLDPQDPVPSSHLLAAAARLRQGVPDIVKRLSLFGYTIGTPTLSTGWPGDSE
ncbi:MAG: hypothetical protein JXA67_07715, partial [Micromonosporaceae bacterium]|nr:hypothetical protein [Micromonosporaceae bacterium]